MIRLELPKVNLASYSTDEEKIFALKKQLDSLIDNLHITLNSIEDDFNGEGESSVLDILGANNEGLIVNGNVMASGDVTAGGKSLKYTPIIGSANGQSMEYVKMYTDGTYAFGLQFKTDENNGDPDRQYNLYAMDYHNGYKALRLRDATDGVNIWTLHEIVTDTFTFSDVSYTAGTIGTRGAQKSVNISKTGYRAIGATIGSISDSTAFIPAVFFNSESNPTVLYGNFYRTATSAKSGLSMTVIVTYMSLG